MTGTLGLLSEAWRTLALGFQCVDFCVNRKNWNTTNALVVTWLFNSVTSTIAGSVDAITSASKIWKALASMYSGVGNVMLLADTDDKIHYLKQGERTLMDYVAELSVS